MEVFIYRYPPLISGRSTSSSQLNSQKRVFRQKALEELLFSHYGLSTTRLYRDQHGKWQTRGSHLELSSSHTENHFLIAVSQTSPIGIDIETLQLSEDLDFIEQYVRPDELPRFYEAAGRHGLHTASLMLWTAKESLLKTTGLGLQIDPLEVAVECTTGLIMQAPSGHHYLENYSCKWLLAASSVICVCLPRGEGVFYNNNESVNKGFIPFLSTHSY